MASGSTKTSPRPKKLTDKQIIEFREVFRYFDKNNDGHITVSELATIAEACGRPKTEGELRAMIRQVDKNKNDTIEFEEFVRLMQITLDECEKDEELMNAFRLFDRDGDGFITTEELRLALRDHGDVISLQQTKELLRKADSDGDGRIDYEEFVKMVMTQGSSKRPSGGSSHRSSSHGRASQRSSSHGRSSSGSRHGGSAPTGSKMKPKRK